MSRAISGKLNKTMRIRSSHLLIVALAALLAAGTACQNKQTSAALLPAKQANAPALAQATAPAPKPEAEVQAQTSTPAVQPELTPDPVGDLVAKVEKDYQAGQDNYKAGHLEAARQHFDRAFNLLLESQLDVRSDDRLQKEFNRVLDGTNGLELQALQEGDGFTEQKSEPAPIDETNDVTVPADPNVRAKAAEEVKATHSDLPLMLTDPVVSYINYFSSPRGHGILEHALERGGRYRDMIQQVLKEEGVPQDLIYLAQAESGFHPLALSRAGARGMWQFMASRAKGYGLERNWWVDDRQDPEKSTRAAAHHLKDLYNQFGDWYLAMAAYNSGPGTVQLAVKRTGYADFWQLYKRNVLPKETRNYVPIIVAMTIMAKNPQQYGLEDVVPEKPVSYDTVKINYPVDLRLVAECVDASAADLQDLNPSLLRMTTPKDQEFELHLPTGTKEKYQTAIAAIPQDMRVWWRFHKVGQGDTLLAVARRYHTTPKAIAEANNLGSEQDLEADSKLIIPIAPGKHADADGRATYAKRITRYRVRKGDTVTRIADNLGIPAVMIRRWNRLKGNSVAGRRILLVHLPVTPNLHELDKKVARRSPSHAKSNQVVRTASKTSVVHHRVKRGETLYSIASSYKTTVAAIKHDNGNVDPLRAGMILLIRDVQ
jgi:membrane-bound lytic murein transglycosylase D